MTTDSKTRVEHDLLGKRELPADALYGIQTLRGVENFSISRFKLEYYPAFINGPAYTKLARRTTSWGCSPTSSMPASRLRVKTS